ncbi:MAG TPA: type II toxin-antitoxin system RelE/ParE family toxin [Stellaceae bacterium]|nr:type II toxin-antitoxin system RelE/ParE family toxin [Stellaceae bacterium]
MAWTIEFERSAERELNKLGVDAAKRILRFLHDRVAQLDDPRAIGEALKGSKLAAFWKYRIGDYRVDAIVRIVVARVGNRREVHR